MADDLGELPVELVHALAQRREVEAVRLVLGLEPARAETELDPATGDVVDGRDQLREHRDAAERDGRDQCAEPDPRRHRGEAGERCPRIERARGLPTDDRAVVVGAEQPVEVRLLGRAGQRDPLLPGDALLPFDHQADAHYSGVT